MPLLRVLIVLHSQEPMMDGGGRVTGSSSGNHFFMHKQGFSCLGDSEQCRIANSEGRRRGRELNRCLVEFAFY